MHISIECIYLITFTFSYKTECKYICSIYIVTTRRRKQYSGDVIMFPITLQHSGRSFLSKII